MEPHRLRAPAVDGGILAEPPLDRAAEALSANERTLSGWDHDFQGRRAGRLRAMVRGQVLARAREFLAPFGLDAPAADGPAPPRLVVTGHQPELFHPGVWVKNFAVASLADRVGGLGLNLIVDNDIPKRSSIRVPEAADGALRTRWVDFDEWAGEIPYEDLTIQDEARFASFADRVRATLGGLVPDPLIEEFWPRAVALREQFDRPGLRFSLARRQVEAGWGARNAEVPLGLACETEGFLWFACHLLAHLPRFQEVHNAALAHYRSLYGIRSRHHPVPALSAQGEWREAPFWAWRAADPHRRPLMARQLARTMQLRIGGEDEPFAEIPLGPDREACCAVEQLRELPARRIRLRTRALTTTMFARLLLGDLFVHGIGGAKYDELGDEVLRSFFGIEPPQFLTLSMTLWLGLEDDPATAGRLREVERTLRDLTFNPDRHLDGPLSPEALGWVEAKHQALAGPVETRRQRIRRFEAIHRCNERLQPAVAAGRARLEAERARLRGGLRRNALAHNREYASVLHSRSRLRAAFGAVTAPGP